jgi:hypothetical protein
VGLVVGAGDGDGVGAAVEGTDVMELVVVLSVVAAVTWALAVLSLVLRAFTEWCVGQPGPLQENGWPSCRQV